MNNQASASQKSSSKRKRDPNSPTPLENPAKVQPISNEIAENLKAQVDSQRAAKYKLAKLANNQISETKIYGSNVTEVLKICYSGLEDADSVKPEFSSMCNGEPENLPTKFLNTAHKYRAQHTKTQILTDTINHVLAACNKSSEQIRANRIRNIKTDAHSEHNRRSVATSSKPDTKYLKVKKKIRFSSPIQSTNINVANIESDHDKIEISIPMHGQNESVRSALSITIENRRSVRDLKKFRQQMSKEVVDFSTFQISQESILEPKSQELSPTKYDESLTFNDTDREIQLELSTVESDQSDSVPKELNDHVVKCEEFNYTNPTEDWLKLSDFEKRKIDLDAVDATKYFENIVQKEVIKCVSHQISKSIPKPEKN